ncbi:MAG: DUF488 domain-containing protein [Gammaproteobacteria bacterium]
MLYARQRTLLALLKAFGGSLSRLDFQKLLFLFCQEQPSAQSYEFVPYRFGGFSFTSYADRRRLVGQGLLADEEQLWTLTKAGHRSAVVAPSVRKDLAAFAQRYSKLRGDALVKETYRRFPFYATRSEIAERLFRSDEGGMAAIQAARPRPARAGICTIGYEGRSLEAYLNRLLVAGIGLLCDVRRNPLSRKYGFSKGTLAHACEGVGIRYEHLPELGIASEERRGLDSPKAYELLFNAYRRETLPNQQEALTKIRDWVDQGERVALTCFEAHAQQCHRHCVADALQEQFGNSFAPTHL